MTELYFGSICSCVFSKLALHRDPDTILMDDKQPVTFEGDFSAAADRAFQTKIPIGDRAFAYLCSRGEVLSFCQTTGCRPEGLDRLYDGGLYLFLYINR